MVKKELVEYIQKAREKSIPDDKMTSYLKGAGWSDEDIRESKEVIDQNIPVPPMAPAVQQGLHVDSTHGTHLWDSFEHALMFISMYVFTVSFALILHSFVDKWLPNTNNDYYRSYSSLYSSAQQSLLRGYLSAIIVSYPIFGWLFLRITKRTYTHPYLQTLKFRTILIYFTLIIAFIIMLGNVISIVNGLLNGNATLNFAMHFAITVGVSAIIFAYYLYQVRKHQTIT